MTTVTQDRCLILDYIAANRDKLPTPLYLYSESALNEAVTAYRELFPDNAKLFYSLKANPQPGIVQHLSSLGLGAGTVNSSSRCKSRPYRVFGTTFLFLLTKTHCGPYYPGQRLDVPWLPVPVIL
jgi:hypothetical protein